MNAPRKDYPKSSVASLLVSTFLVAALLSPTLVRAQDAATLAKYDKNHNGVLDPDEIAAMQADQAKAAQTPVTTTPGQNKDVVTLNPFAVDASKDIGYYAENTLAGSRINTNVGDLAASITVVTKQQLEDTGALNINDVFLYEANTEGANTYTPLQLNRGNAADNIGGYSTDNGPTFGIATANRIRGLGSADTAQDNYPTLARLAFDTYNTNSVEISRGPNSILFGAGTASGVVNNSSAEAVLNQQASRLSVRFGNYGAHRESVSTNVPLGSKVAVFVAALYDDKEFARKPSSDVTRRQYAAITYQPFAKTKITGSFENYDNFNNRPNFVDPADGVSFWLNSGKPGWDPVAQTITLANGTVTGPYLNSTLDPRWNATLTSNGSGAFNSSTSAAYVPSITTEGNNTIFFNGGQPLWFFASTGSAGAGVNGSAAIPTATARTLTQWVAQNTYMTQSRVPFASVPAAATGATSYSVWYNPGVTNKSIYDWTSYNAAGSNYGTQTAKSYKVELNQNIFTGLNLQLGWFRQEMFEWDHYGMGQTNAAPSILVDTNTKLMDGRPNPFFGSPFVYDNQTDTYSSPETNNNLRGMLAYSHDFTKGQGWASYLSFLGKAQLMGLVSQQKDVINRGRWRLSFDGGDPRFLPNQNNANIPNNFTFAGSANIERNYYLGSNSNGKVTQGVVAPRDPDFGGPGKLALSYFDWNSTNTWQTTQMSFDNNLLIAGNGQGVTNKTLDSSSFVYQGSLWENRIIPTLGTRYDKVRVFTRNGLGLTTPQTSSGGFTYYSYLTTMGAAPFDVGGDTTTRGVVARPFSGWRSIDAAAEKGSVVMDIVRGLGFSYNHSDNFSPPQTLQTDFFSNPLPKQSGKGDDFGVRGSMFNNKLSWSVNWYKQTADNAVSDAANTAIGRAQRIDTSSLYTWAREVVRIRNGQSVTDVNFDNNTVYPLTNDQQAQINTLVAGPEVDSRGLPVQVAYTGLPGQVARLPNNTQGTNSLLSKGTEVSLIYNPTRNWNIKLTAGKQFSTYSKASGEITTWLYGTGGPQSGNGRLNFWQNLAAPDLPTVYTRNNGNLMYLGSFWNSYGYTGDANSNTTGATSTPNTTYYSIVDSQLYQLITLQGQRSPSQREYSSSLITNYAFQQGRLKGFAVGGGLRWSSNAVVGYYGNFNPATFTHPTATQSLISYYDLTKPQYVPALTNVDAWVSYSTRVPVFGKSVKAKFQLNVQSLTESGGLQPILFQADGTPAQYRIVDPRQFFLTSTFDF